MATKCNDFISREELMQRLSYCKETGLFVWISGYPWVLRKPSAGSVTSNGYMAIKIGKRNYKAHRLAWLYVHGEWPDGCLDHINGCKSDNRIQNLRICSHSQNRQNITKPQRGNKLLGASFYKAYGKWQAQITTNKVLKHLGYFDTPEEAHAAYVAAKRVSHPFSQL